MRPKKAIVTSFMGYQGCIHLLRTAHLFLDICKPPDLSSSRVEGAQQEHMRQVLKTGQAYQMILVSEFCVDRRCCEIEIVLGTHRSIPVQYHLEMSDV